MRWLLLLLFPLLISVVLTVALTDDPLARHVMGYEVALPEGLRAEEVSHLDDVRVVLLGVLASTVITFWLLLRTLMDEPARASEMLRRAGIGSLSLLGALVIGLLVAFERLFTLLHLALFPQGNWQFPSSSVLITRYPPSYWQGKALAVVMLAIALSLVLLLIGKAYKRATPQHRP